MSDSMVNLKTAYDSVARVYSQSAVDGAVTILSEQQGKLVGYLSAAFLDVCEGSRILSEMEKIKSPIAGSALMDATNRLAGKAHETFPSILEGSVFLNLAFGLRGNCLVHRSMAMAVILLLVSSVALVACFWDILPIRVTLVMAYVFVLFELSFFCIDRLINSPVKSSGRLRGVKG